jgi:hypothetical protein
VCVKKTIGSSWKNIGVPDNSKFAGEVYVGSPAVSGVNIRASTWSYDFPDYAYFGMFSEPSCLPLTEGYQGTTLGRVTKNYWDVTPGIKDPSVFTPRPECLSL